MTAFSPVTVQTTFIEWNLRSFIIYKKINRSHFVRNKLSFEVSLVAGAEVSAFNVHIKYKFTIRKIPCTLRADCKENLEYL